MTCQKMNRRELLNYINEISFAVDDTKLFLDTHPWDQNALLFFNECLITGPGSMSHGHGRKEAAEYVEL